VMAQKSPQMKMLRMNRTENSSLWNELKVEDRFASVMDSSRHYGSHVQYLQLLVNNFDLLIHCTD
jgi:hypothetical protein